MQTEKGLETSQRNTTSPEERSRVQAGKAQVFFPFSCHGGSIVSAVRLPPVLSIPGPWLGEGRTRAMAKVLAFVRGSILAHSYFLSCDALPIVRWLAKAFWHPHLQGPKCFPEPAPCLSPCRARILFLLQLLADHVPGTGLLTSKHRAGCDYYSGWWISCKAPFP